MIVWMVRTMTKDWWPRRPFSFLFGKEKFVGSACVLTQPKTTKEVDLLVDMLSLKGYTADCHTTVHRKGQMSLMTWRIKYWEHNTEQHSDFICFCTAEQRHITATLSGYFSPYSDDLYLLHCTVYFCSSVQEPGVQQPKLMFNSHCSILLTYSWQKQHLVVICPKGADSEANLPAAVYFVAACRIPNKVASHELLLGVEVRPRLTLETCPRAVPGSTDWFGPTPHPELI